MSVEILPPLYKRLRISERFGIDKKPETQLRGKRRAKYYIARRDDEEIICNSQKEIVALTGSTVKNIRNICTSGQPIKGWVIERVFEDDED